jgi:hypothetical protein
MTLTFTNLSHFTRSHRSPQPKTINVWRGNIAEGSKPESVRTFKTTSNTASDPTRASSSNGGRSALNQNGRVHITRNNDDEEGEEEEWRGLSDRDERQGPEQRYARESPAKNGRRLQSKVS